MKKLTDQEKTNFAFYLGLIAVMLAIGTLTLVYSVVFSSWFFSLVSILFTIGAVVFPVVVHRMQKDKKKPAEKVKSFEKTKPETEKKALEIEVYQDPEEKAKEEEIERGMEE